MARKQKKVEEDTSFDVAGMVAGHSEWLQSGGTTGAKAALEGEDLSGADMPGVNLSGATLRNVILQAANLRAAILQSVDLRGAAMEGTDLRGANFLDADIASADLSMTTGLIQSQVNKARPNVHTVLPPGIRRPAIE